MPDNMVGNIFALAKAPEAKRDEVPTSSPLLKTADENPCKAVSTIQQISVEKIKPHPENPFWLYSGERLEQLVDSVREHGIITPLIVRPQEGCYQVISGHNRLNAAVAVGIERVPCNVFALDDSEALELLIESNFSQRSISDMLPSEFAWALQMQMDMFKRNGRRTDIVERLETLLEEDSGKTTHEQLDEKSTCGSDCRRLQKQLGIVLSDRTKRDYLRLNNLHEDLLRLVDDEFLTISQGVQISFLRTTEQELIVAYLEENTADFSKGVLARLREASQNNELTASKVRLILAGSTQKSSPPLPRVMKPSSTIKDMFPAGTKPKTIESIVISALKMYFAQMGDENK